MSDYVALRMEREAVEALRRHAGRLQAAGGQRTTLTDALLDLLGTPPRVDPDQRVAFVVLNGRAWEIRGRSGPGAHEPGPEIDGAPVLACSVLSCGEQWIARTPVPSVRPA